MSYQENPGIGFESSGAPSDKSHGDFAQYDDQIGIELIGDPRARVWYSASPAIFPLKSYGNVDPATYIGADVTPSHPDDDLDESLQKMEMAVAREPEDSERIDVRNVMSAIKYMRSQKESEKGIPSESRTVDPESIDTEEAVIGFSWIKDNVDEAFGERLRTAAITYKRDLNGSRKPNRPAQAQPHYSASQTERQTPKRPSKRQLKKEEQRRERTERLQRHQQDRLSEIQTLVEWQRDNPPHGSNFHFEVLEYFDTHTTKSGAIIAIPRDNFEVSRSSYITSMIEDPERAGKELKDDVLIQEFLSSHNSPIISEIYEQVTKTLRERWLVEFSCHEPSHFKSILPKWAEAVENLPDEYKSIINFEDYTLDIDQAAESKDKELSASGLMHSTSILLLSNSLINVAQSTPDEFVNMAHEAAAAALETEDDFTIKTFLSAIMHTANNSTAANMLLLNTPIALGVPMQDRLKSMDLKLTIEEMGFSVKGIAEKSKMLPSNVTRRYNQAQRIAKEMGIDTSKSGWSKKVIESSGKPLIEALESGELEGCLINHLRSQ